MYNFHFANDIMVGKGELIWGTKAVKLPQFEKIKNRFENEYLDVQELQSWIETMVIPDECRKEIGRIIESVINDLELIIYCSNESTQREEALSVLQDATNEIENIHV